MCRISENPIAANFSILLGSYEVTAPNVTTGNEYAIVCEYLDFPVPS